MPEAPSTEPTNTPSSSEQTVSEPANNNENPGSVPTEPENSSVIPESATAKQPDSSDLPASTTAAQSNADDWAAAMAEQATATSEATVNDGTNSDNNKAPVFEQFSKDGALTNARNDIDMILDIPVQLTVELGRTKIAIKNLMQLAQGSVVELDGLAGEPMDVLVNGCLIAQGEVVVVNDKFGIRLTDIITPSERIRKLNR